MTRNGITIPFPSEFATPPASSSQTGLGSCGFRLWRYALTAFSAARAYSGARCLPSVRRTMLAWCLLIDSSIKDEYRDELRPHVFAAPFCGTASLTAVHIVAAGRRTDPWGGTRMSRVSQGAAPLRRRGRGILRGS